MGEPTVRDCNIERGAQWVGKTLLGEEMKGRGNSQGLQHRERSLVGRKDLVG